MKLRSLTILILLLITADVFAEDIFDPIFPSTQYQGTLVGLEPTTSDKALSKMFPDFSERGINIYGWANPTYNQSTAAQSNLPIDFSMIPNHFLFNEGVLAVEKQVNSAQHEYNDFGFNLTNLYGTDYRFTSMKGVFSQQYYHENLLYGYDPVIANVQAYIPGIGQGTLVTLGRYLALGDIEWPLSNLNYMVTRSLTFSNSAFTQMGFNAATKLNDNWSTILGMHAGSDIAVWSNSAIPTFMGFVQWTADDKNDSIFAGANALNNGQYTNEHDNLQQLNMIWTHRFNEGSFIASEFYYQYQFNGLADGDCTFGPYAPYGGGRGCGALIPGYSSSIATVTYFEKKLNETTFSSFRFDYFNDFQGQRTGFQTDYVSFSVGLTNIFQKVLKIRPELRYDLGLSGTPYDNGTRSSVLIGLIDLILLL